MANILVYQSILQSIPKVYIQEVCEARHDSPGGNYGFNPTLARIQERFYIVNCRQTKNGTKDVINVSLKKDRNLKQAEN